MPPYLNDNNSNKLSPSIGKIVMTQENGEEIELSGNITGFEIDPSTLTDESLKFNSSCDITLDLESSDFNSEYLGFDLSNAIDMTAVITTGFIKVNVRSHKKKRINKKWGKKYGTYLKPIYKTMDAKIIQINSEDYNGEHGAIIEFSTNGK